MDKCAMCGAKALVPGHREKRVKVGEYSVEFDAVPVTRCEACGETYMDGKVFQLTELSAGFTLAAHGVCTPELLRFMRKSLGMRATDLAELLGVCAETISHWETGATSFDCTVISTLADLVADRAAGRTTTENRLRAMQGKPPKPSRPIPGRLDFPEAA